MLGWAAEEKLLTFAGARVTRVAGCCGLVGDFGMEKGHYEVSAAIAETHLLPTIRAHPDAVVLADGMSCTVQLDDLARVPAVTLPSCSPLDSTRGDRARACWMRAAEKFPFRNRWTRVLSQIPA
ncbi:hypothetical protein [Streptomyces lutosisoli]|uniref:Cysteine-rich domain-containing protein n=1 Tax=Streptomyces lutosisoli TaxID=2665721 RepID=A0ABW2W1L9_9ACTN